MNISDMPDLSSQLDVDNRVGRDIYSSGRVCDPVWTEGREITWGSTRAASPFWCDDIAMMLDEISSERIG